ncbi:uncharacterized protein LOC133806373 [Humulus lupulus]|uniref:uncharacterized protein LOC133806373 n=1 Tax=Humulus lupulus TaxID=3486 RepID=UPI002B40F7D7|nr:uncharacterized protein LOC133806373 [Humulus lupulus]
MKAFIKSLDKKAWRSILRGWTPPTESDHLTKVKSEINWIDAEDKLILPDKFQTKLTAIEEPNNLDTMKVVELMGSLRTFELNQQIRQKEKLNALKEKSIAFKSSKEKDLDENDGDYFSKHSDNSNKRGVKCRECEGFGHIQYECANTLKKNEKVMTTTWSDQNSESSDEEDNSNLVVTTVVSGLTLNSQQLSNEIDHMVKGIKMLHPNSRILDDVIDAGPKTGNIVRKGTINLDGLPKLRNVFLVEGLKAKFISISQIRDKGFTVNLYRDDCNDVDQNGLVCGLPKLGKESAGKCESSQLD